MIPPLYLEDIQGLGRLTLAAIGGLNQLADALGQNMFSVSPVKRRILTSAMPQGFAGLNVTSHLPRAAGYGKLGQGIDKLTGVLDRKLEQFLCQHFPVMGEERPSFRHEAITAALNGVLGDYLVATGNPLAIPTRFTCAGQALLINPQHLAATFRQPTRKLFLLVHGLCMNDLQWIRTTPGSGKRGKSDKDAQRQDQAIAADTGMALDEDFYSSLARESGHTLIALHYNSGRHISTNGREFADMLEQLVKHWPAPIEELVIVANSMGGLVTRSACHYAAQDKRRWPRLLRKIVFLGTPHHGAPLERGGNWVDATLSASPYTEPLSRFGRIRSAGITDLRYGNLLDEDWEGVDRFERTGDRRKPVPLPTGVDCYTVAASSWKKPGKLGERLIGDGLVPVDSALGRHCEAHLDLAFPVPRQQIAFSTTHMKLLDHPFVKEQVKRWLNETS